MEFGYSACSEKSAPLIRIIDKGSDFSLVYTAGFLFIHLGALLFQLLVVDVVVILHELVDCSVWSQLYDAVCHGLYELVVMAAEEDVALESYEVVVESLNALEVEMVSWCVEYETVGIL